MARNTIFKKRQVVDLTSAAAADRLVRTAFTSGNSEEWWLSYISILFTTTQTRDIEVNVRDTALSESLPLDTENSHADLRASFGTRAQVGIPKHNEIEVQFSQTAGACSATVLIVGFSER